MINIIIGLCYLVVFVPFWAFFCGLVDWSFLTSDFNADDYNAFGTLIGIWFGYVFIGQCSNLHIRIRESFLKREQIGDAESYQIKIMLGLLILLISELIVFSKIGFC